MTKIHTESPQSQRINFADQNIISEEANITNISPSSSEINRHVEQQLEFTSSYFEKLQQHHPELPRSGGGVDDTEDNEIKKTNQPLPSATISEDVTFLIDSTIQQLTERNQPNSQEQPNYYKLLGGGRQPPEEWEAYQDQLNQQYQTNKESVSIKHNRILVDKTGKTDPLFYIRKASSNLNNTPTAKLLIYKVILAWKHTLHNEHEASNYITSAFLLLESRRNWTPSPITT
jgi:hypothetical protein